MRFNAVLSSTTDTQRPDPTGLWRLLPQQNLAASVYGTILVSSVIVGLAGTNLAAGEMMGAVAVTAFVFVLAHAWATSLARSGDDRRAMSAGHLLDGLRHEWPMVEAVAPTLLALALAVFDVYTAKTGLWVAIIANTVLLFVWGAILRHRAGGGPVQILAAGLTTAALGLMLVALKALVH